MLQLEPKEILILHSRVYIQICIARYSAVSQYTSSAEMKLTSLAFERWFRDTTASHSVLRSPSVTPLVPSNTHHNQRHICHMQTDDAHLGVPRCMNIFSTSGIIFRKSRSIRTHESVGCNWVFRPSFRKFFNEAAIWFVF